MPPTVIAAARSNLTEEQKQLADHLARVDEDLRTLEQERRRASRSSAPRSPSRRTKLRGREESIREREDTFRRRLDTKLDDQLRDARREIDRVIEELKRRAPAPREYGRRPARRGADARAAVDQTRRAGRTSRRR